MIELVLDGLLYVIGSAAILVALVALFGLALGIVRTIRRKYR